MTVTRTPRLYRIWPLRIWIGRDWLASGGRIRWAWTLRTVAGGGTFEGRHWQLRGLIWNYLRSSWRLARKRGRLHRVYFVVGVCYLLLASVDQPPPLISAAEATAAMYWLHSAYDLKRRA